MLYFVGLDGGGDTIVKIVTRSRPEAEIFGNVRKQGIRVRVDRRLPHGVEIEGNLLAVGNDELGQQIDEKQQAGGPSGLAEALDRLPRNWGFAGFRLLGY